MNAICCSLNLDFLSADSLVRHLPNLTGNFSQRMDQSGGLRSMAINDKFDPDSHDPMIYDHLARMVGRADRVIVACEPIC